MLDLSGQGLTHLHDIEVPSHTEALDLSDNALTSLAGLPDLPQLHTLLLPHNALTDLAPMPHLPALRVLSLSHNRQLTALTPLASFSIERLFLLRVPYADLAFLAVYPGLVELALTMFVPEDTLSLAGLEPLRTLRLSGNVGGTFLSWPSLINLEKLTITQSQLLTIQGIERFSSLRKLALPFARVEDLSPLAALPHLTTLDLRGNPISAAQVHAQLQHLGLADRVQVVL